MGRLAAIAAVILGAVGGDALGCSCGPEKGTLEEQLVKARLGARSVFLGRVKKAVGTYDETRVTFDVMESFGGPERSERVVQGGSGSGDCSIRFAVGEVWLIYGRGDDALLRVHVCSRTRQVNPDDAELTWLRAGTLPPEPVAVRRELVECLPCNIDVATLRLVGPPPGDSCNGGVTSDLLELALAGKAAFWHASYRREVGKRPVALGRSGDGRLFELTQDPDEWRGEVCREHVTLRWCASLKLRKAGARGDRDLECVGATAPELFCDEAVTLKAKWGPYESSAAARCESETVDPRDCKLPPTPAALGEPVKDGPMRLCRPAYDLSWAFSCSIGPDPSPR